MGNHRLFSQSHLKLNTKITQEIQSDNKSIKASRSKNTYHFNVLVAVGKQGCDNRFKQRKNQERDTRLDNWNLTHNRVFLGEQFWASPMKTG